MKKGELLILSINNYADEERHGPFRALKDFRLIDVAKVVKELHAPEPYKEEASPEDVLSHLKTNGYIEEVPCQNIHLGSSGYIWIGGNV
jgi:hypothetical protein